MNSKTIRQEMTTSQNFTRNITGDVSAVIVPYVVRLYLMSLILIRGGLLNKTLYLNAQQGGSYRPAVASVSYYVEAKRHCTENGYVPKWKKQVGRVEKSLVCSHPRCSITSVEARLIAPH
jgi:hypothetical protein